MVHRTSFEVNTGKRKHGKEAGQGKMISRKMGTIEKDVLSGHETKIRHPRS